MRQLTLSSIISIKDMRKYSIGYFYYDTHEPCWELKFVGGRFKELLETDVVAVFKMLKAAYDTLEEWSNGDESDE